MAVMQRNACLCFSAVVGIFAFIGVMNLAHAIPVPPKLLLAEKVNSVRVLIGSYARFSVSGYDLVLNDNIHLAGTSAFNVRCGKEPGSDATYIEFGAGRRAIGRLEISSPTGEHSKDRYLAKGGAPSLNALYLLVVTRPPDCFCHRRSVA